MVAWADPFKTFSMSTWGDIKIEHDHPRTKHCPKRCRILSVQPFAGTTTLPRLRKCSTGSSLVSTRCPFFSCCTWMCDLVEFINVFFSSILRSLICNADPRIYFPSPPCHKSRPQNASVCMNLVWIWYTRQASHLAGCWLLNGSDVSLPHRISVSFLQVHPRSTLSILIFLHPFFFILPTLHTSFLEAASCSPPILQVFIPVSILLRSWVFQCLWSCDSLTSIKEVKNWNIWMDFQGRMRRMTVLPGSIVAKAVHGAGIAYLWPCFMAGAVGGVYLQPAGRFRTPHKNHCTGCGRPSEQFSLVAFECTWTILNLKIACLGPLLRSAVTVHHSSRYDGSYLTELWVGFGQLAHSLHDWRFVAWTKKLQDP